MVKEEDKKKKKGSNEHAFWINFNLDSLKKEEKEETTNLYLMAKGDSSNFDVKKVSPLIHDDLLNICVKLHAAYKLIKIKNSSLRKIFTLFQSTYNSFLSEHANLKENLARLE